MNWDESEKLVGLQLYGSLVSFRLQEPNSSHSEDLRKILLWLWHGKGKSNHGEIFPESCP